MKKELTFGELCEDFFRRRPKGKPIGQKYWFTTQFTSGFQSLNDLLRNHLKANSIQYFNTVNGDVWFLLEDRWRKCEFMVDGDTVRVFLLEWEDE